jgi:hypothetical protein
MYTLPYIACHHGSGVGACNLFESTLLPLAFAILV